MSECIRKTNWKELQKHNSSTNTVCKLKIQKWQEDSKVKQREMAHRNLGQNNKHGDCSATPFHYQSPDCKKLPKRSRCPLPISQPLTSLYHWPHSASVKLNALGKPFPVLVPKCSLMNTCPSLRGQKVQTSAGWSLIRAMKISLNQFSTKEREIIT